MASAEKTIWLLDLCVQLVLLMFLVSRREHRRFPAFCSYLAINLLQGITLAALFSVSGFVTRAAWIMGWGSQAVVTAARVLAVGEIFRRSEERRVGKECRCRWWGERWKKKVM